MAEERQSGLGGYGRRRFRQGLGDTSVAGHPLYSDDHQQPLSPGTATAWKFPDSTRVKAYQYDPHSQQLRVRFHKYNTPWVYNDVPVTVFQAFDAADSKGRYINSTLNFMDYRRATHEEEADYFGDV